MIGDKAVSLNRPKKQTSIDETETRDLCYVCSKYACFGEALLAISRFSDLDFASPPSEHILELLDAAYTHMSQVRPNFTPEDFSLYVFSLLLECCQSDDERSKLKLAASKYLIGKSSRLSADFRALADHASSVVARAASGQTGANERGQGTRSAVPNQLPSPYGFRRAASPNEDTAERRKYSPAYRRKLSILGSMGAALGMALLVYALIFAYATAALVAPE